MFWRHKREESSLAATLRKLQADLVRQDDQAGESAFLVRLTMAMDKAPEPFEWILMILRKKEEELTRHQAVRSNEEFFAWSLKQRELSAEVRLLRTLSRMSIQAQKVLQRQAAMAKHELEDDENEGF